VSQGRRLSELAALVEGEVRGDGERSVRGIATLGSAAADDLSFLTNAKYVEAAARSRAGALIVGRGVEVPGKDLLVCGEPYFALARLLEVFHPVAAPPPGVDSTARVAADAEVDVTATVGALAVVGARTRIGARVRVEPHATVGEDCVIDEDSVVHPHAVLYRGTIVGKRCTIHAGVVLGADGFGYATHRGRHHKVPQVGVVVIEDDVEIGANATIDRAMLEETRVGAGTKVDNLVMVAHNVRIGRGSLLIAQSGVAGSTQLGDGVVLAGQSGVVGHLRLGNGVQVAGIPAQEASSWRRQQALLGRLDELRRRVAALERAVPRSESTGRPESAESAEPGDQVAPSESAAIESEGRKRGES
jgi:UDP-3-O-[3-hydroxymyristoyl] glucosamine N-acyltransferase